jgi:hypothetical protein
MIHSKPLINNAMGSINPQPGSHARSVHSKEAQSFQDIAAVDPCEKYKAAVLHL